MFCKLNSAEPYGSGSGVMSQGQPANGSGRLDSGQFQIHLTASTRPAFLIILDLDIEVLIKALFEQKLENWGMG